MSGRGLALVRRRRRNAFDLSAGLAALAAHQSDASAACQLPRLLGEFLNISEGNGAPHEGSDRAIAAAVASRSPSPSESPAAFSRRSRRRGACDFTALRREAVQSGLTLPPWLEGGLAAAAAAAASSSQQLQQQQQPPSPSAADEEDTAATWALSVPFELDMSDTARRGSYDLSSSAGSISDNQASSPSPTSDFAGGSPPPPLWHSASMELPVDDTLAASAAEEPAPLAAGLTPADAYALLSRTASPRRTSQITTEAMHRQRRGSLDGQLMGRHEPRATRHWLSPEDALRGNRCYASPSPSASLMSRASAVMLSAAAPQAGEDAASFGSPYRDSMMGMRHGSYSSVGSSMLLDSSVASAQSCSPTPEPDVAPRMNDNDAPDNDAWNGAVRHGRRMAVDYSDQGALSAELHAFLQNLRQQPVYVEMANERDA